MWVWKYWDVAIAVVGFLIQCGLAWLGLTLTHWKHKAAFFLLVLVGAVFTGFAVKRGIDSASQVQAQLNTIQRNTERPQQPPVVTVNPQINMPPAPVPPPEHTHLTMLQPQPVGGIPYWPLSPQKPFEVNVGYTNAGEFEADDVIHGEGLTVVETEKLRHPSQVATVYHELMDAKQALRRLHELRGHGLILLPHTGDVGYMTVAWGAPKQADIDQFLARQTVICVPTRIEWKDKSGCYFSDSLYCLVAESGSPGYNWHHEMDQETKCH
jgi:hypothetical protein